MIQRDHAYHNGTVWPWLLGPFTEALVRFSSKAHAGKVLQPCIQGLWHHVTTQAGIGCISEIFDAAAPHRPRGCIQQAWSVAEVIRMVHLLQ
jgi:glycogen debranching enzyme